MTWSDLPDDLPTDWVDNIGMVEDAAFLNKLGGNVNAIAGVVNGLADAVNFSKIEAPPQSGWTPVNMLSGWTFAADGDDMLFSAPGAGGTYNLGYQYRAYPTPPFTLTACIVTMLDKTAGIPDSNKYAGGGLVISDGTKYHQLAAGVANASSAGAWSVGTARYVTPWRAATNSTSPTLATNLASQFLGGIPTWFQVADDGTNLKVGFSFDGRDFAYPISEARATYLTPSRIGIGAHNHDGSGTFKARLRSWKIT